MKHIVISRGTELLRIPADSLMYIASEGNYSTAVTRDGRKRLISLQLGQIEDIISEQLGDEREHFLRLGRSLIINMNHIHFIDIGHQQLILSDCERFFAELSASREVLIKLKSYVEALAKDRHE